jgi:hypothetical protein
MRRCADVVWSSRVFGFLIVAGSISHFFLETSVAIAERRLRRQVMIDVMMPIQGVYSGEMRTNLSSPGYISLAGVQAFLVLDHNSHNAALKIKR